MKSVFTPILEAVGLFVLLAGLLIIGARVAAEPVPAKDVEQFDLGLCKPIASEAHPSDPTKVLVVYRCFPSEAVVLLPTPLCEVQPDLCQES